MLERRFGGAAQDLAVESELRFVTGTAQRNFGIVRRVPLHDAAQMSAFGRNRAAFALRGDEKQSRFAIGKSERPRRAVGERSQAGKGDAAVGIGARKRRGLLFLVLTATRNRNA